MSKYFFCLIPVLFLLSCSSSDTNSIVVRNTNDFDRVKEIIEVNIPPLISNTFENNYILTDENGNVVPYQISKDTAERVKSILFPVIVPANSEATYHLKKGTPPTISPMTYVAFVPEHNKDLVWENEFAGYRMFGSGINVSNGVDFWLKRTKEPIMEQLYHDEINKGQSFYVDRGKGVNAYKIGNSLGAGGVAPFTDKLWINGPFDEHHIIEHGPLRSVFQLVYDSVQVDTFYLKQIITVTVDAGSIMNKAVVHYEGEDIPMRIAAGIYVQDNKGTSYIDTEHNIIAYAEDAYSRWKKHLGRNYIGVYMPGVSTETLEVDDHLIIVNDYRSGYDFTYFFGGGWNENGFPEDKDWFESLSRFSQSYRNPLKISFK